MDAESWSAIAAVGSLVTATIVAVAQIRRDKKQKAFDLYEQFKVLPLVTESTDVLVVVRAFNTINYTARIVQSGHIDKRICIDLFGWAYVNSVDGIRGLKSFNYNGEIMTGQALLEMSRYSVITKVRTSFYDSLVAEEHNSECNLD